MIGCVGVDVYGVVLCVGLEVEGIDCIGFVISVLVLIGVVLIVVDDVS